MKPMNPRILNFQRSHVTFGLYGGYGARRAQNYRGSYDWDRGYGYGKG
ncbi:hypothetical protein CCACVL1_29337, partial [Corchorus capsularis]